MTRIYLSIILAACLFACAKHPKPPVVTLDIPYPVTHERLPRTFPPRPKPVPVPVIVTFAKGSYTLSSADSTRLATRRIRKAITVTGYASSERGNRPAKVEAARNYLLSLRRAQAVCAVLKAQCTAIAGGETDAISPLLDGNRIAGFIP